MEALQRFFTMLGESAILRQSLYQVLIGAVALAGAQLDIPLITEKLEVGIDLALQLFAIAIAFYTMWTRIAKPSPNLSETAKYKEVALVKDGTIPPEKATSEVLAIVRKEGQ